MPTSETNARAHHDPAGTIERLQRCRNGRVGVLQTTHDLRLVAVQPIAAGEPLFQLEGETTTRPSRYTVQIGEQLHLDAATGDSVEDVALRSFWRFMNHSCEPTTFVQGRTIVAQRDIAPGEPVTFDYNTTEWSLAEPFACHCGSASCVGAVRGFKHLTAAQRARLREISPHLLRMAQGAPAIPAGPSAP